MIGLFEQWEAEKQQKIQKNAFNKSCKLISILMSKNKYLTPSQNMN